MSIVCSRDYPKWPSPFELLSRSDGWYGCRALKSFLLLSRKQPIANNWHFLRSVRKFKPHFDLYFLSIRGISQRATFLSHGTGWGRTEANIPRWRYILIAFDLLIWGWSNGLKDWVRMESGKINQIVFSNSSIAGCIASASAIRQCGPRLRASWGHASTEQNDRKGRRTRRRFFRDAMCSPLEARLLLYGIYLIEGNTK